MSERVYNLNVPIAQSRSLLFLTCPCACFGRLCSQPLQNLYVSMMPRHHLQRHPGQSGVNSTVLRELQGCLGTGQMLPIKRKGSSLLQDPPQGWSSRGTQKRSAISSSSRAALQPRLQAQQALQNNHSRRRSRQGPASSRRFTPAQQAVTAALMVVMKRAMKDGKEAALTAKQILISNNPATSALLKMLPDDGLLPTMQQVEQKASKQLRESLAKLAKLCESAGCKPLEVFTRSAQCTAHKEGPQKIVQNIWTNRQQCVVQSIMPQLDTVCEETVQIF